MASHLATVVTPLVILLIMCHRILAINIPSNIEVEEKSRKEVIVSCNELSRCYEINCRIIPLHGQEKQVPICGETCRYCQNIYKTGLGLSRFRLCFEDAIREWAGTVVCKVRLNNEIEHSVNSTLDVYYNSGATNVSMVVHRENWTLVTSFTVAQIFSARGNYGAKHNCTSLNSTDNVSLVSYNKSSLMYNVGSFQLTSSKSQFDQHVNLACLSTIIVYPGAILVRPEETGGVSEPSSPQIKCDLTYIPEEGPFRCSCNSQYLGNPEGRLTWRLEQQVLTSGDYGVRQLPLPSDIVNRSHEGKKLVCEVEWLCDKRSEMNILVAYGPDDLVIELYIIRFPNESRDKTFLAAYPATRGHVYFPPNVTSDVTLKCQPKNVQPWKSEMVTWGGLCDGQQGFTCKLTFKGKQDDGKEVTCSAINNANNNHKANTSIIINVSDGPNNVQISIQYHTTSTPGKCLAILTCDAPEVKPSTYDMFTWDGMCEGQQGSRCVITADEEEDDGKEVTCTVTNHVNHGRAASAIVTLMLPGCEDKGNSMSQGVGTGIGVILTLEMLMVGVVVVVVFWRRRRFQRVSRPWTDTCRRGSTWTDAAADRPRHSCLSSAGPHRTTSPVLDIHEMYDKPIQDPSLSMSNTYDSMRPAYDAQNGKLHCSRGSTWTDAAADRPRHSCLSSAGPHRTTSPVLDIHEMYDKPIQDPSLSMRNTYDTMRPAYDAQTGKSQNSAARSSPSEIYENITFTVTGKQVNARQQHRRPKKSVI